MAVDEMQAAETKSNASNIYEKHISHFAKKKNINK